MDNYKIIPQQVVEIDSTIPVDVTISDIFNNSGLDTILTKTSSPIELKVGSTKKEGRKYVLFMPLDSGFSFGFSESTQNIPVFKKQLICLPVGEDVDVWFNNSSSGVTIAIGEL